MRKQIYIPLVQQDLSHEETILQISLSLEKLEKVVGAIFSNVSEDLEQQKKTLNDINERCSSARATVERLTGIDTSIQVFSSSKFPGPTPPTFYERKELKIDETERDIRIPYTPLAQNKLSMNEKLKFYHIKDPTVQLKKNESITPLEGLGPIPDNIKTVNSLLLFNTKQNLYAQYKILDPLAPTHKHVAVVETILKPQISPAPRSLAMASSSQPTMQNYFYLPSLQDVPDINAPLNLPNLTGIAGDLVFGGGDDQIDFSVKKKVSAPAVESVPKPPAAPVEMKVTPEPKTEPQKAEEVMKPTASVAQLPPPPPPPPPPPMPPPDMEFSPPAPVQKSETTATEPKAKPAPPGDSHADLMAAIRNAGGSGRAKLKPVAQDDDDPAKKKPGGAPGNLMDDLHSKLSMRRKGISGKLQMTEDIGTSMLGKINRMIPPPPPKDTDSTDDDGSDWEE